MRLRLVRISVHMEPFYSGTKLLQTRKQKSNLNWKKKSKYEMSISIEFSISSGSLVCSKVINFNI
jgi:hypothetical protein